MPARPNPSFSRSAVLAGAGVAGLAALFVAPAAAHAAPVPASDKVEPQATTESSSSSTSAAEVTPDYGYQKYRVGVRGKNGDYFPDGTSSVGTKFTITETPLTGAPVTTTCTSEADGPDSVTQTTFCPGSNNIPDLKLTERQKKLQSVNEPTPDFASNYYQAAPGTTVTVTQQTVKNNLVIDSSTATLAPCVLDANDVGQRCGTEISGQVFDPFPTSTDLVFVDPGVPPVATNDSATTKEGVPVTIDIKSNDVPNVAPLTSVKIVADPKDGTAKLISAESADPAPSSSSASASSSTLDLTRAAAGSRSLAAVTSYRAIYTPKAGFTGVDTFRYTITTQNGTATATVRVTVTGAAASDTSSAGPSADTNDENDLADTGTQSGELVGYGAALLAAGAGALAIGQKRRRGRHAR